MAVGGGTRFNLLLPGLLLDLHTQPLSPLLGSSSRPPSSPPPHPLPPLFLSSLTIPSSSSSSPSELDRRIRRDHRASVIAVAVAVAVVPIALHVLENVLLDRRQSQPVGHRPIPELR